MGVNPKNVNECESKAKDKRDMKDDNSMQRN